MSSQSRIGQRTNGSLHRGESSPITVRQLQYLVAVGREGNFSKAARACHVSVASLAEQMNKLEERLGKLFERGAREVRLTAIGQRVLTGAEATLRQLGEIERMADQPETLRIGMIETVAPYLMPALMTRRPERIIPVQAQTQRLLSLLENKQLDAAVLAGGTFPRNFSAISIGKEQLLLASRFDDQSFSSELVSISEIADHEVLLLADGHCLRDQVLDYCGIGRSTLGPLEASTLELLVAMVVDGMGVTLVPRIASDALSRTPGVRLTSIAEQPQRELFLVTRGAPGSKVVTLATVLEELMSEKTEVRSSNQAHRAG
jgi:LysR family hydrogen peroxide-inducible transcriptional activator